MTFTKNNNKDNKETSGKVSSNRSSLVFFISV